MREPKLIYPQRKPLSFWLGFPLVAGVAFGTIFRTDQRPPMAPVAIHAPVYQASGIVEYSSKKRNSLILTNEGTSLRLFCDADAYSAYCAATKGLVQGRVLIHYFKYGSRNIVRDIFYEGGQPYVTWEQRLSQLQAADQISQRFSFIPMFIIGALGTFVMLAGGAGPVLIALRIRAAREKNRLE